MLGTHQIIWIAVDNLRTENVITIATLLNWDWLKTSHIVRISL